MTKKIFIILILIVTTFIIYSCDNAIKVEDNAWKKAFENDTISIDTTMMGEMQVIIIKYVKQRDTLRDTIKINTGADSTYDAHGKTYSLNFKEDYPLNQDFPFIPEQEGMAGAKLKITYKLGIPTFVLEIDLSSKRKELEINDYVRNEFVKKIKIKTEELTLLTGYVYDYKSMKSSSCEIEMQNRDKKTWTISDNDTQMNFVISNLMIEKNKVKKIDFQFESTVPTSYNVKYKAFKFMGQLSVTF